MVKEYQKLNPSNARIEIDYEKNDVKMEYVHNNSAFKTCFFAFFQWTILINLILLFIVMIIYTIIITPPSTSETIWRDIFTLENCIALTFFIWIIVTPTILALIFSKNEKLLKMMPEINYKLALRKPTLAEFKPEDVMGNKCEIPLFRNIGLDYQATGDFNKYLTKVKINEHGFNDLIKGKKKLNPYLWKAMFYFKQAPKTGSLEVMFK